MSTNYVCAYSEHEHTTPKEYMNLGPNPRTIPASEPGLFLTVCKEHYDKHKKQQRVKYPPKHTPVEWRLGDKTMYYDYCIYEGDRIIAYTTSNTPEDKERALLIAAAPELLEVLKKLQASEKCNYTMESFWYEYGAFVEQAIAKAEGRVIDNGRA